MSQCRLRKVDTSEKAKHRCVIFWRTLQHCGCPAFKAARIIKDTHNIFHISAPNSFLRHVCLLVFSKSKLVDLCEAILCELVSRFFICVELLGSFACDTFIRSAWGASSPNLVLVGPLTKPHVHLRFRKGLIFRTPRRGIYHWKLHVPGNFGFQACTCLDCYWVGSLDFNFLGNNGVFH